MVLFILLNNIKMDNLMHNNGKKIIMKKMIKMQVNKKEKNRNRNIKRNKLKLNFY